MNLYDAKTKPRGSLGRLEEIGMRIVEIRGRVPARLRAVVVVAAGDHGVVEEGVSAYPQEVTAQMVANFRAGGAAVNVLARAANAEVVIADRGVGAPTRNMTLGPAMAPAELERELAAGERLVDELGEVDVVALGEMGIGNSTAAALTPGIGHTGLAEGGHLVEDRNRRVEERQSERGAGALAEPQAEIEQRLEPERVQHERMPWLGTAMRRDQPVANARG